ncbi:FXYD domain-containing ion transport regulator 6-like isoform X3 [Corythoichthys intestinalis]|nr:FXYD domain-containing ion transport regulator 6-like isoform X3 [Corythoichthys intestinalis]XP_057691472.1 FXYD domain-containing ion transport regulator 6-like isoform X3 [Corythoichthys intestinalis]XP_057691473.1 FXYD domain-containing ion transport regulator 6-like isoform X3 [Corythoichthys intestinalis]
MDLLLFVVFISSLTLPLVSSVDSEKDYDSAFEYDYESLRIGGLVFAVVLFLLGIALIVSRKCVCKKSDKSRSRGSAGNSEVPRV